MPRLKKDFNGRFARTPCYSTKMIFADNLKKVPATNLQVRFSSNAPVIVDTSTGLHELGKNNPYHR